MGVIHEFFSFCDLYVPKTIGEHGPVERESEVYELYQIPLSVNGCRDMKILLD